MQNTDFDSQHKDSVVNGREKLTAVIDDGRYLLIPQMSVTAMEVRDFLQDERIPFELLDMPDEIPDVLTVLLADIPIADLAWLQEKVGLDLQMDGSGAHIVTLVDASDELAAQLDASGQRAQYMESCFNDVREALDTWARQEQVSIQMLRLFAAFRGGWEVAQMRAVHNS